MNESVVEGLQDSTLSQFPDLSVVVPTLNERENVAALYSRVSAALDGIAWELIFVDDNSPDGTWERARQLARTDPRVRCLRRIGRRGLSGACIEGALASSAAYVAVIDGDLQHDETKLKDLLSTLRSGAADIAIGSRYMEDGRSEMNHRRRGISVVATTLVRKLLRIEVHDPLSGFFMIRRELFEQLAPALSVHGFKILLDILVTARGSLRVREIPYVFGAREQGESKLGFVVTLDFLGLILAKLTSDVIPLRFVLFSLVGSIGLIVHFVMLNVAFNEFEMPFAWSQTLAAVVAMTSNYLLNNVLTFQDQRLRGTALLRGLLLFYVVCSVGLFANVGLADWVYGERHIWWLAGAAGALLGAAWNYVSSSLMVWRAR